MRWAILLLFAALPLQWLLIPGLPAGAQRVHVLAIIVFTAFVFFRHRARASAPVVATAWPFLAGMTALLAVWFATSIYHGQVPRSPVQEAVQMLGFVAVGTVIYRAARDPESRVLEAARWTALVCAVSLLVALSLSMALNGVDPIAVLAKTISTGNPEIVERELFRSAFTGFGYDEETVRGNIRHEMLGAVLIAMCLSATASRLRPFTANVPLRVYQASLVLGTLLILVSLSRSAILAAAAWPVLAAFRSFLTGRVSDRQLLLIAGSAMGMALGAVTGFLSIIWVRFTEDTASYEGRGRLFEDALSNISANVLTGGVDTESASSHNFILDSWLRTGVFGAAAALGVTVLVVGLWFLLITRLGVEPSWMLPVTAMMAAPVVRMFTAGGGVIPPVQWVGLGIVAGFLAYRAWLRSAARTSDPELVAASPARTA